MARETTFPTQPANPPPSEIRALWRLAGPVVAVQLGIKTMDVVDTLIVGHVSKEALASVALAALYSWSWMIFAHGCLLGLDPILSHAVGAGDDEAHARNLQRGLILAVILTIPVALGMVLVEPLLAVFQQPAEIIPGATLYTHINIAGILPLLVFAVLRTSLQAKHRLAPVLWGIVLTNIVNVVLDWALVFGELGFPALGIKGSAWATVLSRWLLTLGLLAFGWRDLKQSILPLRPAALKRGPLLRLFRVGLPIGFHYQLELGAFALVGLLMGLLGSAEMAGHQVALNLASLSFMVPMGISVAASVRVGNAVGRQDQLAAARSGRVAMGFGTLGMVGFAILFLGAPTLLAELYTPSPDVILVAASLLPLAGIFQIFDGLQVVADGVLRGLGDTRTALWAKIIAFWVLGVPLGCLLAFAGGLGARGLWWGLVISLATLALFLTARALVKLNIETRRLAIDDDA